jgi:hypothetical protein
MMPGLAIAMKAMRSPWLYVALLALAAGWYRHSAQSWRRAYDAQRDAYAAAVAAGKAATRAAEAKYHIDATETQHGYEKALSVAQDRTDGYIRANRVQDCAVSPARGAESGTASVPAITASDPIVVAVESGDVKTCTADHEYAQAAYELGQRWIRDGLAIQGR